MPEAPRVTDEQLIAWERIPVHHTARETVQALIADLRVSRVREAVNSERIADLGALITDLTGESDRFEAERDALQQRIDKALAECDRAEMIARQVWDALEDYADLGDPKGEYPDNACLLVATIRAVLTGMDTAGG